MVEILTSPNVAFNLAGGWWLVAGVTACAHSARQSNRGGGYPLPLPAKFAASAAAAHTALALFTVS